jgi:hypothetical protein
MKKGSLAAKKWGAKMRALRNKAVRVIKTKKRSKKRGVVSMARKRRYSAKRVRSRSRGIGGGKLMRGLFPITGILGLALTGVAAKTVNDAVAPQMIPHQDKIAAFAVGGLPGVAGAFALEMFKGKNAVAGSSTAFY